MWLRGSTLARSFAVHFGAPAPLDVAAERFAVLCDAAAERNLQLVLEFPAFATIADVATAWTVIRLTERPNAGVLIVASASRSQRRRRVEGPLDPNRVYSVQLSDGAADPVGPPFEDVMHHLPGAGDLDVTGHLRLFDALGVRAPIGIELFDEALLATGPIRAAERLANSLRQVVSEARRRNVEPDLE